MSDYPSRLLERVSEPAAEPISLSEAKTFLRIDGTDEDSIISDMISAARMLAEELSGKCFIAQSWKLAYDRCPPVNMPLPFGPVQSITSVKTFDEADNETLIASSSYYLNAAKDVVVFETVPSDHRVEVVYVTGYGANASDVPADLRHALLIHVAHLYEHRDSMSPPQIAHAMYAQYREVRL